MTAVRWEMRRLRLTDADMYQMYFDVRARIARNNNLLIQRFR